MIVFAAAAAKAVLLTLAVSSGWLYASCQSEMLVSIPNQPHLLNKYQINMGFSYFHGIGVLSGINILVPYQIDVVKSCGFSYKKIIFI